MSVVQALWAIFIGMETSLASLVMGHHAALAVHRCRTVPRPQLLNSRSRAPKQCPADSLQTGTPTEQSQDHNCTRQLSTEKGRPRASDSGASMQARDDTCLLFHRRLLPDGWQDTAGPMACSPCPKESMRQADEPSRLHKGLLPEGRQGIANPMAVPGKSHCTCRCRNL